MSTGSNRFDLVVIGSGPAGQKGAIAAAKLGKRVESCGAFDLDERKVVRPGGTCFRASNYGA